MAFCRSGASKSGALEEGIARGLSSGTRNEMMSTMLETSFLTFSGSTDGRSLPVSLRLHRYMAKANSGKRSWPDFVVSARILVLLILATLHLRRY